MKRTLGIIASVLMLQAAVPDHAQARAQKERLLFDVMFGGLHVADVVITLDQSTDAYESRLEMRTRGVAQMFQDFRADMKSEGAFTAETVPAVFTRAWRGPETASEMTMRFDPVTGAGPANERLYHPVTGEDLKREDMPWYNRRNPTKPVPEKLLMGAVDPVSAFISARRQMLESGQSEVRVPIYDGRRRYDIISTVGVARTFNIRNQERTLIPITSRVEPVYGFAPDSEDRMRESEGTLLFTNDQRFVPVQIILSNEMFSSVMNLVAECNSDPAPCDSFGQQPNQQQGLAP